MKIRKCMAAVKALGLSLLLSTAAHASTQVGKVTDLYVRASDGLIYFVLDGAPDERPACAANHSYFMIKSETSLAGRHQYALLLAAKMAGKTVTVVGFHTCTRWPDGEDVDQVQLMD
jgi:hypothetical protein